MKVCAHCGVEFQPTNARGPAPKYCSARCKADAKSVRGRANGAYARNLEAALAKREAERAERPKRPCPYCGTAMNNVRRFQCGAKECQRQYNRESARQFSHGYKKQHGVRYEDRYKKPATCSGCGETIMTRHGTTVCKPCSALSASRTAAALTTQRRLPVLRGWKSRRENLRWKTAEAKFAASLAPVKRQIASGPCFWCEAQFTAVFFSSDIPRYCSSRCSASASKAKYRFQLPRRVRLAIYERDGWTCQLCRDPVDPELPVHDAWAATLDHIECQSWALIPDHSPENLRLAHRWCNSVRGNETYYTSEALFV